MHEIVLYSWPRGRASHYFSPVGAEWKSRFREALFRFFYLSTEGTPGAPDWLFPREEADHELLPAWRPTFVDYLFLAFCTAAAFTPAEAMPMTMRAKLLTMAEGLISLVTVLAIASRTIELLGS